LIHRLKHAIGEAKKVPRAADKAARPRKRATSRTSKSKLLPKPVELPVLSFRVGLDDVIASLAKHGGARV
jgi:hypothetical protein